MALKFDLERQRAGPLCVEQPVPASIDEGASPAGVRVAHAAFGGHTGSWQVRARVSGQAGAAWRTWISFHVL